MSFTPPPDLVAEVASIHANVFGVRPSPSAADLERWKAFIQQAAPAIVRGAADALAPGAPAL